MEMSVARATLLAFVSLAHVRLHDIGCLCSSWLNSGIKTGLTAEWLPNVIFYDQPAKQCCNLAKIWQALEREKQQRVVNKSMMHFLTA